jgi:hypothetical protein
MSLDKRNRSNCSLASNTSVIVAFDSVGSAADDEVARRSDRDVDPRRFRLALIVCRKRNPQENSERLTDGRWSLDNESAEGKIPQDEDGDDVRK